jgi:hypothetical protein
VSKSSSSTISKTCWTLTNFELFTTWVGNETYWLFIEFFIRDSTFWEGTTRGRDAESSFTIMSNSWRTFSIAW